MLRYVCWQHFVAVGSLESAILTKIRKMKKWKEEKRGLFFIKKYNIHAQIYFPTFREPAEADAPINLDDF